MVSYSSDDPVNVNQNSGGLGFMAAAHSRKNGGRLLSQNSLSKSSSNRRRCEDGGRALEPALAALDEQVSRARDLSGAYASLLRRCADARVLSDGKRVHDHMARNGYGGSPFLANCLVQMYGKCGSLDDARQVFDASSSRNEHSWSAIISAYARNRRRREAFDLYKRMETEGMRAGSSVLLSLLGTCSSPDGLAEGRAIHAAVAARGLKGDVVLDTALVNMYAKCGSLDEARAVFDKMPQRDVITYTAMIAAYAQKGHQEIALDLYREMDSRGVEPNNRTFASVLSACSGLGDIEVGRAVHRRIIEIGVQPDVVLQNALVNMYAKCGSLHESRMLFDKMPTKNVGTWNAMVAAHVQHDLHEEALGLYHRMDTEPNAITFACILGACCSSQALEEGKAIHRRILSCGVQVQSDEIVQNSLVSMYTKCGSLEDARRVFDGIGCRNVCSWTAMITGYAQHGCGKEALELYKEMVSEGVVEPDIITYASALSACSSLGSLEEGRNIHARIVSRGMQSSKVDTSLIDMYGKCGSLEDAMQVFESILEKDVISWTVTIAAYAQQDHGGKALELFRKMDLEGVQPNNITFARIVGACSSIGALEEAKAIHARTDALGLQGDEVLQDGLLSMYVKCGSLNDARGVFERLAHKNVFSWTIMISAYNQQGYHTEALELYHAMDLEPDGVTFVNVLSACSSLGDLEEGKAIHARISSRGFPPDTALQTALSSMYARCGSLGDAREVFDGMKARDVVSWTALISAYAQQGCAADALKLYRAMALEGVEPNSVTFSSVLSACASLGSLRDGKLVHARIAASGFLSDTALQNGLVNMYSKGGRMDIARRLFDDIAVRNHVSWSTMIGVYVQHGYAMEALQLYHKMDLEGVKPNDIALVAVLGACSILEDLQRGRAVHARALSSDINADAVQNALMNMYAKCGSVDEARVVFDRMQERSVVSWTTMIGAYVQHGRPAEALDMYQMMDVEANFLSYACTLSACASLGALREGKEVHARLAAAGLEGHDIVVTALVNMYAKCGSLDSARRLFDTMPLRDAVAWNSMFAAYAQYGHGKEVTELYWSMCLEGVEPNGITFISILISCSHIGQLQECQRYFEALVSDHGIVRLAEHYACMIDLLGRSGRLDEAERLVSSMPTKSDAVSAWMSLLGACKTHNDAERAARAAEKLYELDPGDTAPYVLLSQIYAAVDEETKKSQPCGIQAPGAWQKK